MTTASPDSPVGDLVRQRPAFSRVLEQHRIDYCCGGKTSLADACARRRVDPMTLLAQFNDTKTSPEQGRPVDQMGLAVLADHIVSTHHAYLRAELPRLDALTLKVASVHGQARPSLHEVRRVSLCVARN